MAKSDPKVMISTRKIISLRINLKNPGVSSFKVVVLIFMRLLPNVVPLRDSIRGKYKRIITRFNGFWIWFMMFVIFGLMFRSRSRRYLQSQFIPYKITMIKHTSMTKANSLLRGLENGRSSLSVIFKSVRTYVLVTISPSVCFFLVPAQINKPIPKVITFSILAKLRIKAISIVSGFSSLSKALMPTKYLPMVPLNFVLSMMVFIKIYKARNIDII